MPGLIGEWVAIKRRPGAMGFILEWNYQNCVIYVIDNGEDKGARIFSHHSFYSVGVTLTADDYKDLHYQHINMALDTQDRDWFSELHGKQTEGSK